MREKEFHSIAGFAGRSLPGIKTWGELELNYKVVAEIDQQKCIHCGLCYIACEDAAHQSICAESVELGVFLKTAGQSNQLRHSGGMPVFPGSAAGSVNVYTVKNDTCVGCNLCQLVCPVDGCISMKDATSVKPASVGGRAGKAKLHS